MNKKGFTLLEVTLFLAVSAGLLVIAVAGLGPRLRNVRFTAAVRGVETSLIANIANNEGINNRPASTVCNDSGQSITVSPAATSTEAGAADRCVLNGVVGIFRPAEQDIIYRPVVSSRLPANQTCVTTTLTDLIRCHKATLLNQQVSNYAYTNGLEQAVPEFDPPLVNGEIGFGYVQDPNGTTKYPFLVRSTTGAFAGALSGGVLEVQGGVDDSVDICYGLGPRQARLTVTTQNLTPRVAMNEGCTP